MTDSYVEDLLLEKFLNIKTVSNYARCNWTWIDRPELESYFSDKVFKRPAVSGIEELPDLIVTDKDTLYEWYLSYNLYPEWNNDDNFEIFSYINDKHLTTIQKFEDNGKIRSELFPDVSVENVKYIHPDGDDNYWYEVWFLPSAPIQIELGTKGRCKWVGNIQVNICVPKNCGIKATRERYDEIAEYFRSGVIWEGVKIFRTSRGRGVEDENCYTLPVTIEWHATLDR